MNYKDILYRLPLVKINTKIHLLRTAGPVLKKILYYAYHPFLHYNIQKVYPVECQDAVTDISSVFPLLDALSKGQISGNAAKEQVFKALQQLEPFNQEIFIKVLKKDLRCGIGAKTILKALPGLFPSFGVMLAKKWDDTEFKKGLCMSIKIDGIRAIYEDGKFYSRLGNPFKGLQKLARALPLGVTLDGELSIPGKHFQEVCSQVLSYVESPDVVYNIFDTGDLKKPFKNRYKDYTQLCSQLSTDLIKPVKHIDAVSVKHIHKVFEKVLTAGYEGLVIKPWEHKYVRTRSSNWLKLKARESKDLLVIDRYEGTGKYQGKLGGLIVDHQGTPVRVGSGFSDKQRENEESYIGKIIEVLYHEVTPDNSLRHPIFKGVRHDKHTTD